jgi:hypothetical protein
MKKPVTLQEKKRLPRIVLAGFSAVTVALSVGIAFTYGQNGSPSFQYVAAAGGELRGSSTNYTAHPGSRQLVYFSNDKLTIAATIEVEDIRDGVARLKVRAKSYPGTVGRETSERELKSALQREYTYVPVEKLSMPVDGGGVLSLVGAIADKTGNLSKALASHPVEPEPGQILLMFPALLRGDRVLVNLKMGAGTGPALSGNPAVALYAPPDGLFIFALQPFEGATACDVILGRAVCSLKGNEYTLFSARPITGGDQETKIWVRRVSTYIPSKVGVSWRDDEGSIKAGELSPLLAELRVEGFTARP